MEFRLLGYKLSRMAVAGGLLRTPGGQDGAKMDT